MNTTLFYSSIIIGIIIIAISIYFYNKKLLPLYAITYVGIATSIINHGITSNAAKNLDRTIMLISAAVYIYYGLKIQNKMLQLVTLSIVVLMMLLYVSSKFIKKFIDSDNGNNLAANIHVVVHCISLLLFGILIINEYLTNK
jgi:hypothetical protein